MTYFLQLETALINSFVYVYIIKVRYSIYSLHKNSLYSHYTYFTLKKLRIPSFVFLPGLFTRIFSALSPELSS